LPQCIRDGASRSSESSSGRSDGGAQKRFCIDTNSLSTLDNYALDLYRTPGGSMPRAREKERDPSSPRIFALGIHQINSERVNDSTTESPKSRAAIK